MYFKLSICLQAERESSEEKLSEVVIWEQEKTSKALHSQQVSKSI